MFAGQAWTQTSEASWSEVHHDPQFSGYSVGSVSPYGSQILALGNIRGAVKLMELDENGIECVLLTLLFSVVIVWAGLVLESISIAVYRGKVFSLNWALSRGVSDGKELLFSCGPDGSIVCHGLTLPLGVLIVYSLQGVLEGEIASFGSSQASLLDPSSVQTSLADNCLHSPSLRLVLCRSFLIPLHLPLLSLPILLGSLW